MDIIDIPSQILYPSQSVRQYIHWPWCLTSSSIYSKYTGLNFLFSQHRDICCPDLILCCREDCINLAKDIKETTYIWTLFNVAWVRGPLNIARPSGLGIVVNIAYYPPALSTRSACFGTAKYLLLEHFRFSPRMCLDNIKGSVVA